MKLFGSTTSPFVRRARIALLEAGVAFELVNTATDAGQAELRKVTPIWKVPVLQTAERTIFDSLEICDFAARLYTSGRIARPRDHYHGKNLLNAIDGVLESAIPVFYLKREKIDVDNIDFANKQYARIAQIAKWLRAEANAGRFGRDPGLAELSWLCTLDWMAFRKFADPLTLGDFSGVRALFADWDSVAKTAPSE